MIAIRHLLVAIACIPVALLACGDGDLYPRKRMRHYRNYELSLAFDQRCDLSDDSHAAEVLEERIQSEYKAACGSRIFLLFVIMKYCERGNVHWIFCDGTAESIPPDYADGHPLTLPWVRDRARSYLGDGGM
jgi:hypothetical protein